MRLAAQGLAGQGLAAQGLAAQRGAAPGLAAQRGAAQGPGSRRRADGRASEASGERTPVEVVRRMVAMQGQDLAQVLRAIAIRSAPGTTLSDVRAAFDRGELVRSWPMRGTLFVTTPDDLAALLAWTAERIRRKTAPQRLERDLDDATIERAAAVADAALAEAPRSRAAMLAAWEAAGIETGRGRGYMLILLLAIRGRMHWGPFGGTEQLLVPSAPCSVDPDAGLAAIACRYVGARGPVTVDDFAWWTGLTKKDAGAAFARADGLVEVVVDGEPMWAAVELFGEVRRSPARSGVVLVPGFDEWILGYRYRSHTASPAMLQAIVPGNNGVFKPVVLVDGRTVGTWRWPPQRVARATRPILDIVEPVPAPTLARIERALAEWPHR